MGKGETEENSQSECNGRRKQSRERKPESENKNNFRESRHQAGKEYQAGSRMSQQEQGKGRISCRPLPVAECRRASFFFFFRGRGGQGGGRGLRRRGMREGRDDFGGGGFAGLAIAVVDAALRESVLASAGAGFGVEFVERGNFLFRR